MSTNCGVPAVTGIGTTCGFPLKPIRRAYLMPLTLAADGVTANEFATVAATTSAAIIAKIEAGDMFPLPLCDNTEDLQGDPTIFEYASNSKEWIQDGVRDVKFMIPSSYMNTDLLGRLKEWNSREFGYIYFDTSGALVYSTDDGTKVQPIVIEGASWNCQLVKSTYEEPNMISVAFNEIQDANDEDLRIVAKDTLGYNGLDQNTFYGLAPVYMESSVELTTGITVQLTTSMGVGVSGFLVGEFTYTPAAAGADSIASATEDGTIPGKYVLAPTTTFTVGAGTLLLSKTKYQKSSEILAITTP